ncbi:MAG TPA: cbb3-type cytochrome oxidase assembly protein CcoS [Phycisphaerales bacterium]|jgi:cbb3-type cytochrome oxidase maturation protein|nr:cbb3-type cytochrome oxidase assembly protein CcoS [Phycisphaerales bacterium]HPO92117.1 cbb3-type cytochrome oxidase assembly protein CcoS [Phycisphaerales bacterium]
MSILYLVVPLAILLAAGGVGAFIWAVKGGQYDDIDSPAVRAIHDDD